MSERSSSARIRGARIGGRGSFETQTDRTEYAARARHRYVCLLGHETSVDFHVEAVPPGEWTCTVCPAMAIHENPDQCTARPEIATNRKTHLEQLKSRRTDEELEALLKEALSNYRRTGKAF